MLNKLGMCGVALALCMGATCLSIAAQDDKPKEDPAKEEPSKEDPVAEGIKRADVPDEFKKKVAPDLKDQELIDAGKKAYDSNCAGCHGETGKGDGKKADKLDPRPTDLTSAEFQDSVTDQYILWRIKTGAKTYAGEGTSKMKSVSAAGDERLWQFTAYVRSLRVEKVEPLSPDEMEELMDNLKAEWKNLRTTAETKDADKASAAADKIAGLSGKLAGYDGDVHGGDHDGEKVRDQADWKKFVEDFKKAAEEYSRLVKAGEWDKAGEEQPKIGDGCGNCHDVYKKKKR